MQDFQHRVIEEVAQLTDRLDKLAAFIASDPKFSLLTKDERKRILERHGYLCAYLRDLCQRINAFKEDGTGLAPRP